MLAVFLLVVDNVVRNKVLIAVVLDVKVVVIWSLVDVADIVGVLVAVVLEVKVVLIWSVVDVADVVGV